jgi:O-antigen/teichoic acid export membrane protein
MAVRALVGRLAGKLSPRTWAGLASVFTWQAANYLLPLLTFPYLARVLGVQGFGYLGVALAVQAFASIVVDWGFAYTAARAVAQQRQAPDAVNRIIWATVAAKLGLALPTIATVVAGTMLLVTDPVLRLTIFASLSGLLGAVLSLEWALRGSESFRQFTATSVAGRLLVVPLFYLLVHEQGDVWIAAGLTSLSGLFVAALTIRAALRQGLLRGPELSFAAIVSQLAGGSYMFISAVLTNIYSSGLSLILVLTSGTHQAGLYSGADRTKWPFISLLNPVIMVAYPKMSALAGEAADEARRTALSLLRLHAVVGSGIAIALFVSAPLVVAILLGDQFDAAVPVLRILSAMIVFNALNSAMGTLIMLPFGLNRQLTLSILAGAITAALTAPFLCLSYGALGAAVALNLAEAAVTISLFLRLRASLPWFRLGFGR